MKIITVFCLITDKVQSSVRVTGFLGGRIMMKCRHPLENPKARFLCRESEGECPEKTYTNVQNEWQQNGGFSLYDDTSGKSLMVFFRNLTEGTYRCGVDVSEFTDTSVYMNTSLPTNSSDKNTATCIYYKVQLAKDEGPSYATVSFQKNPDSCNKSTVAFIKEESSTEYAAVKHHPRLE
ncbi:hypothetical protein MHYP_G00197210 [Metynnis hypsauchen]